jgi:2-hydroxy-6-oxonona-2,4-dienedioate hydrolase
MRYSSGKMFWLAPLALGLAGLRAWRWRKRLLSRLENGSWLAETDRGRIEYGLAGIGKPALVLHGTPGGYDQGLALAKLWAREGTGFLAVSRPGYLQTPLHTGRTPEEQADVYAALLDRLGIAKVPVIAASGGGPSGIQFAVRHPDRISRLVLLEAVSGTMHIPDGNRIRSFLERDFAAWAVVALAWLWQRLNFRSRLFKRMPDILVRGLETALPLGLRREGIDNDVMQKNSITALPLERIRVPTLLVHGMKDTVVPYAQSERAAQLIPDARLLTLPEGNHFTTLVSPLAIGTVRAFLATPERRNVGVPEAARVLS